MYADDSKFYIRPDINRSLTTNSKPLYEWINANRTVVGLDKTECMLLGTRQKLIRTKLYFTGMIQPLIDYGCVIWGNCEHILLMNVHKRMTK